MFDSPVARCEIIREMVLTDETQLECAREHDCPPDRICPLARYFVPPVRAISGNPTGARPTLH
jgi:hypothetical protein